MEVEKFFLESCEPKSRVSIKDRKYGTTTYAHCFLRNEAVVWLRSYQVKEPATIGNRCANSQVRCRVLHLHLDLMLDCVPAVCCDNVAKL